MRFVIIMQGSYLKPILGDYQWITLDLATTALYFPWLPGHAPMDESFSRAGDATPRRNQESRCLRAAVTSAELALNLPLGVDGLEFSVFSAVGDASKPQNHPSPFLSRLFS